MVSADGSRVTTDGSDDPRAVQNESVAGQPAKSATGKIPGQGVLRQGHSAMPARGQVADDNKPATVSDDDQSSASPESKTDEDGRANVEDTKVRPAKKQKEKKPGRRQRKISRLVMEFQPDAVEMEYRKVAGGLRWTLYVVVLLLVATISWAWWAKVDRLVTADGELVAVETFVISAPQTGTIKFGGVKVSFGDTVKAGQTLVELDPTFSVADVKKLETRSRNLSAEIARLKAEQENTDFSIVGNEDAPVWNNQRLLFLDRQREMQLAEQQYQAELRKLTAKQHSDEAEVDSLKEIVAMRSHKLDTERKLFDSNAAAQEAVRDAEMELSYARKNVITAENTVKDTVAQFDVLKSQHQANMSRRQAEVSAELATKRQELMELQEDIIKAERSRELAYIYAPIDYPEYKVVEIVDRSSVAQPGQPIMRLIPVGVPLELEVKVQTKDIALIRPTEDGSPRQVRVKLSAFPHIKHGTLDGYVKTINEDVSELGQPGVSQPFYYVRIALNDGPEAPRLRNVPDANHRLRPGMAGTAEVKVGTRRVLEYFTYPLWESLTTSIREN